LDLTNQLKHQANDTDLHEGENSHSKNNTEKELVNEHLKSELKVLKEEFKAHKKQQLILLKQNKQNIIDFIIDNKDSIKI
jgi:hypothetical protein